MELLSERINQKFNITNKIYFVLFVLFILSFSQSDAETEEFYDDGLKTPVQGYYTPKVYSPAGKINGVGRRGYTDEEFLYYNVDWFLGIPYAKPPVGPLRFKKTERLAKWSGTRTFDMYGPTCPMYLDNNTLERFSHKMDEDCLYLNIFAPYTAVLKEHGLSYEGHLDRLRSGNVAYLMPVMVFIHGGSYEYGSGNIYIGDILSQFGVVVVTINYRLGMLGFLSANSTYLRGNFGLHDQKTSLEWVRDNIAYFGGNPERVTIFGNSAGAASVGLLSISPLTKGLFKHVIIQSGSPMGYWAYYRSNDVNLKQRFKHLAFLANCTKEKNFNINNGLYENEKNNGNDDEDIKEMVECLRSLPYTALFTSDFNKRGLPSIKPTNDDDIPCMDDEIFPYEIEELFKNKMFHPKSLLIGIVQNEWSQHLGTYTSDYRNAMEGSVLEKEIENANNLTEDSILDSEDDENLTEKEDILELKKQLYKNTLKYVLTKKLKYTQELADLAHFFYFPSHLKEHKSVKGEYIKFVSDISFLVPSVNYARLVNKHSNKSKVFLYVYSHHMKDYKEHIKNNYHSIELNFIFGNPFRGNHIFYDTLRTYTEEDRMASHHVMKLWTNFAKTGDPSKNEGRIKPVSTKWEVFDDELINYANITNDRDSNNYENFRSHYVEFWNNVSPKINEMAKINNEYNKTTHSPDKIYHVFYIISIVILAILVVALTIVLFILIRKLKSH